MLAKATAMTLFKKFTRVLYKAVEGLSVMFLLGMVLAVCYVVFTRYVTRTAPRWGEELACMCMVWFSLLSAALPIWDNRHIRITLWELGLPPRAYRILEMAVHVVLFLIIVLMAKYGLDLLQVVGRGKMSGLGVSYIYLYGAIPVSSVFMLIATIDRLGDIIGRKQ